MNKQKLIPKLADELSFHQFDNASYFVHQKKYDHRVKITEDVYNLLQIIDGKKNLSTIKDEIKDRETLSIDFLYNLLYIELGKYGIVQSNFTKIKQKEKPSYLKLSFIVIPARIVKIITPYLKFFFLPNIMKAVLVICSILILINIFSNFDNLVSYNLENINWALFLLLGFISVTFHEFGHAAAAEYFGAKHGGIGGGFYLFSPVYFADVTDIWKLKPKHRIIVNLAGIYFELIICSIYLIIAFFTNNELLLILGAIIFLRTLFNLNPFLRSDGYWVLTDSLGIANLYKISNNTLKNFIKSLFSNEMKFKYTKKQIFLSIYASVNYLMSSLFVFYVLLYNSQSVIYFPYNLYKSIESIIYDGESIKIQDIGQFIVPLLFYYLLYNFIKDLIRRKISRVK